jgi:hypothetical protein
MRNGRKREEQKSIHMTLDNGLELVVGSHKHPFGAQQRQLIVDFIASIEPTLLEGLNRVMSPATSKADVDAAFAGLEEGINS